MPWIDRLLKKSYEFEDCFIEDWDKLRKVVDAVKEMGSKVVLTQGVFDMYHDGHGGYLLKAKQHGDVLIVGIDSDALTQERKGPTRPLDPEYNRLRSISLLGPVDFVTLRPAGIPLEALLELVEPHTFIVSETTEDVQGGILEGLRKTCKKWGGEVVALPPQSSTSTTARLRKVMLEGTQGLADELQKVVNKHASTLPREVEKTISNYLDGIGMKGGSQGKAVKCKEKEESP